MQHSLQFGRRLGAGAFAEVYQAWDAQGHLYAVKKIAKSKNQEENIAREVEAGRRLHHECIGKFVGHYEDQENDFLVFEFIKGYDFVTYYETLRNFQEFSEEEAKNIISQLVSALQYCHSKGVMHLDLKLDNIMVDGEGQNVKLIDFGLCDFVTPESGDLITRRCGSEEYCAPEILMAKVTSFSGMKLDVFSLGVVLYCLLGAQFPFDPKRRKQTLKLQAIPPIKFKFEASPLAIDLVAKMLESDPAKRISMEQVASHPWLQQCPSL
jgi:serine/threonine protein kinase